MCEDQVVAARVGVNGRVEVRRESRLVISLASRLARSFKAYIDRSGHLAAEDDRLVKGDPFVNGTIIRFEYCLLVSVSFPRSLVDGWVWVSRRS
jgi:hypothetical protein